jgi:Zn-dependent M28 family amino/carboxypeptidase
MTRRQTALLTVSVLVAAVLPASASSTQPVFDEARFRSDIRQLASDEFEGRAPASPGGEKTAAFIEAAFRDAGLEPAAGDGYRQEVPLVSITTRPDAELRVTGGDRVLSLAYRTQVMVGTKRLVEQVDLESSDLVFAGYGIVAPEYGWDDYDGLDATGKTVVVLVNDPGFASGDPGLFRGRTMTYYGRWTYKYEEAARQGAAGILIVHETGAAGYGWPVVANSWSGPQLDLERGHANMDRAAVEGWLSRESAASVFAAAGMDLDAMIRRAHERGFRAVPLGLKASVSLRNTIAHFRSANVVGYVPGTRHPDETVMFMAHWDHLGRDPDLDGDQIYNGAVDNATGTAALIALARAFAAEEFPRSVVFAALTAEESGLMGSAYYADHPLFPLETTVAGLNMDGMNVFGPTRDVVVVGWGQSELEDILARAAAAQDRVTVPEPSPEKGFFYRSDHFHFAKKGVPVLNAESGVDDRARGADWGRARSREYLREDYHRPSDEYDPNWNLAGALEDMQLYLEIGRELASSGGFPRWRASSEFRAVREESASRRRGNGR